MTGRIPTCPGSENNPKIHRGQPVVENNDLTEALTREAVDFIDRHEVKPTFLLFSKNAVHSPWQGADAYMKKLAHLKDIHRRVFAAMLADLDDSVSPDLTPSKESGLQSPG